MMTPEQREQACLKAIMEACQQWGCDLSINTDAKRYGAMIQIEPSLQVQAKEGWHDPDDPRLPEASAGE